MYLIYAICGTIATLGFILAPLLRNKNKPDIKFLPNGSSNYYGRASSKGYTLPHNKL